MNYLLAFIFCGFVCVIAQLIYEYSKLTPGHITSLFVVIGAFLDLFHIYDKLVEISCRSIIANHKFWSFVDAWSACSN